MSEKRDKLGFILVLLAFTCASMALLLDASCSRTRPVQQREVAEELADDYPVPKYEKMARRPDIEGVYDERDVDELPEFIKEACPAYPRTAHVVGITATVVLAAVVDEKGSVTNIIVLSSTGGDFRREFEEEAVKAVSRTQYKPAIQDGHPVPCWIKMTFRFRLDQQKKK